MEEENYQQEKRQPRRIEQRNEAGATQEAAWPRDVSPATVVCDNLIEAVSAILEADASR